MGFLEGMRKQREVADEAFRQRQEEERKQKDLINTSKKHYVSNGLGGLVGQLCNEIKYSGYQFERNSRAQWDKPGVFGDGSFMFEFIISKGPTWWSSFQIITTPEGEIRFNGDKDRGSSIVPKKIWENNSVILEEALGKAYGNPRYRQWEEFIGASSGMSM